MNTYLDEDFLSSERLALIDAMLDDELVEHADAQPWAPLERAARDQPLALSFAQQRLWFLAQLDPESTAYTMLIPLRLDGSLDPAVLEASLNQLVARHEALRTSFNTHEGQPVQIIAAALNISLVTIDLEHLPADQREAAGLRHAQAEARRSFDLAAGPLLRATLLRLAPEQHLLLLTLHHSVADGWSLGVLVRELVALYQAASAGAPPTLPILPIQYADYAVWQRQWLQGEPLQRQLDYWTAQLAGAPALLELPNDLPRPPVQSYRGSTHSLRISPALTQQLKALSRQADATLFMTLLAAFQLLLARYSGQQDIVVGTPIAGRTRPELEGLIGMFTNTLALRADLAGTPSFRALLGQVRQTTLDAYDHQELPFELLVDQLQPTRNLARSPLFQVMFMLQNLPAQRLQTGALRISPLAVESQAAKFDLTLALQEVGDGLQGSIEYASDLFEPATTARMAEHFQTLLAAIAAAPERPLAQLAPLSAAEQAQLAAWNATAAPQPGLCLHQLIEAQVARTPQGLAVAWAAEQLSYAELNAQANQLARSLRERGVGPETLVGVCLERTPRLLVALLAVLKAGGAYLPLDPGFPPERLAFMRRDSRAALLLSDGSLADPLGFDPARVLKLDQLGDELERRESADLAEMADPQSLAYVIYTSGSTGQPKGVQLSHANIVNFLSAMQTTFALTSHDALLALTTLSFDIAVLELFLPLTAGATVLLAPRALAQDGFALVEAITTLQPTLIQATPATWLLLLEAGWLGLPTLRLLCGGEALSPALARLLRPRGQALYNLYGPTETTVWSSLTPVVDGPITVGHPIANTQFHVLDAQLQPVPIGVLGELFIGGAGVARGYFGRAALTAERFVPDPFSAEPGARLYRTGDLGRLRADGSLLLHGRRDQQVKLRGFRIELGEIEAVLTDQPQVEECAVLLREDRAGDPWLVAYVVGQPVMPELLRAQLRQRLPEYMLPSVVVPLPALPRTPNGKLDRKALPEPMKIRPDAQEHFVAPRTGTEQILASIWEQVLGLPQVGVQQNFFELGGHSLASIRVISKAKQYGLQISPRQFFEHPTIAALALAIQKRTAVPVDPELDHGPAPLLPNQQWFFEQDFPQKHHFNSSMLLELQKPLTMNVDVLKEAVARLIEHHASLRARFTLSEGRWMQVIVPPGGEPPVSYHDFSALAEAAQRDAIEAAAAALQTSLNLEQGPILRVAYFDLGAQRSARLMIVVHHLAIDAFSQLIFNNDLMTLYQQLSQGNAPRLPDKTLSARRWSELLREQACSASVLSELDFWRASPDKPLPALPPLDHPDGIYTPESVIATLTTLDPEETHLLLRRVREKHDVQLIELLLAAAAAASARLSGENVFYADLLHHGREVPGIEADVSRTMGWFVLHIPVLLDLRGARSSSQLLRLTREQYRRIPNGGVGYDLLRYMTGDEQISKQLMPRPKLAFTHDLSEAGTSDSLVRVALEAAGHPLHPTLHWPYLLQCRTGIVRDRLYCEWASSSHIYTSATLKKLEQSFFETLRAFIAESA